MLFFIRQSVNVDLIPPRRDLGLGPNGYGRIAQG